MGSIFGAIENTPGAENIPAGLGGIMTFLYILIAVIYFYPMWKQYQFGSKIREALNSNDNETLREAFSNLKSYYKFIGIMTIIVLSLYLLSFIILAIVGVSSAAF